jgi:NodT family efflux transporter outer membrane factor (OMF) lipoprotein
MNKIFSIALSAVAMVGLSSCHIYQKYELPEDNAIVNDYKTSVESAATDSTSLCTMGWEQVFTDPALQTLIHTALSNNKDLDNARLNIDIARAQLKGAKLSYFPSLAFSPNGGGASYGGSTMSWSYTLPLAASWEVDVFAKLLNNKRAAQVGVEQAEAYQQAVQSQIICGVASTYYAIMLMNQQLDLTRNTAEIWKEQVETMELMKNAGRANEAAVVQSRANYYSLLASIPDIEQQIHILQNSLSLLLNTYHQEWYVSSDLDFNLPTQISEGIPVSYLASRPDVKAAERSFAAAYYATNIARTNFYPTLAISAQGGFTNLLGSVIMNPGKWFIQLAGSLTVPLFSRGRNIAALEAAKAQQQQALNNFQYAVLNASAEVSDALIEINKSNEKGEALMVQIENLEKSVDYTQELFMYNSGTTYLEVLTARSSLLSAQISALNCWHAKVSALISLYQAVGGGH